MLQSTKKWVVFVLIVFAALFSFSNPATAEMDDLDVNVICPSSVSVGGSVTIGLEVTNHSYTTVYIDKAAITAAYPGAEILGPYLRSIAGAVDPGETITVTDFVTYSISTNIPGGSIIAHGVCLFGEDLNDLLECGGAVTEVLNN